MATKARESTGRVQSEERSQGERGGEVGRGDSALRAHEALPHTPPWGKPPETPAPFPSGFRFQNGGNLSRVRKPRNYSAPLTDSLRSEDMAEMRERGLLARAGEHRVYAEGTGALRAHEALPHTPSGGKPPETPCPS